MNKVVLIINVRNGRFFLNSYITAWSGPGSSVDIATELQAGRSGD